MDGNQPVKTDTDSTPVSLKERKQMAKEVRFEKIYTQGMVSAMEIWVDKETGVHYLFCQSGYGGGLTPLLDSDGKVVVKKE